jgi:hypothetical protein
LARPAALALALRARIAAPAALALALLAALAPAARAGWSKPFELVKPGTLDFLPAQLAFSPSGSAAAGYAITDVDTPGSAQAYVVSRSATGVVGTPVPIPGARLVLALGFERSGLVLLTGTSPAGLDCCNSASALDMTSGGAVKRSQTLVSGLAGGALGQLVPLSGGRMLAAVATERGVWTLQAGSGGRFTNKHRLSAAGQAPESLSAAWLGAQNSVVVWTAATGPAGFADPRSIFFSNGSRKGGPHRAHTLLRAAVGHRIDELAVARRAPDGTAAWIESWYDKRGSYHSQVRVADFARHPKTRALSPTGAQAAGLTFAANASGAQGVAWKTCTSGGGCSLQVATRGPSASFRHAVSLGGIDASQSPALSVGPRGQVLVGWVRGGRPMAAVGSVSSGRFGKSRVLSSSIYALDMTVAFGPRRDALAAWTQGTLNSSVVGADYR